MCGRFSQTASPGIIAEQFEVKDPLPLFNPRYNIAPSQQIAAIYARRSTEQNGASDTDKAVAQLKGGFKGDPSLATLRRLARALKCIISELVE